MEAAIDEVNSYLQKGNWGSETEERAAQPRKEEGGFGCSKPSLKTDSCTVQASGSRFLRKVSTRFKPRSSSVGVLQCESGNLLAKVIIRNFEGVSKIMEARFIPQVAFEHPVLLMAPRMRATPRRGRNFGKRGSSGGRGNYSPRRISPLARVSPPSFESEESGLAISNSVQSVKFKFKRRTNKPIVTALVTTIFSEEDEEEGSWKAESEEKTPPSSDNSAQRKDMEDSSYSPTSLSKLEEESTFGYSEEQAEVSKEIGSLKGKEPMEITQPTTEVQPAMPVTKQASPQSHAQDKEPDNSYANILYLKLPPGIQRPEDIPDGMEVTWERDPEKEAEQSQKNLK